MADKDAKLKYLNEHVQYELLMLRYSFHRLSSERHQLEWNAHWVSFGVHARNLYKFLRSKDSNSKAIDYTPGFTKTIGQLPPIGQWEREIFHMGKTRPASVSDGKLTYEDARKFVEWVERNFDGFISQADEPYRSGWRAPTLKGAIGSLTLTATNAPSASSAPSGSSAPEYIFLRKFPRDV
jgi:hypothetical protein